MKPAVHSPEVELGHFAGGIDQPELPHAAFQADDLYDKIGRACYVRIREPREVFLGEKEYVGFAARQVRTCLHLASLTTDDSKVVLFNVGTENRVEEEGDVQMLIRLR